MPRKGGIVKRAIPNVRKVVAVASGKGGVGKSTVAGEYLCGSVWVWRLKGSSELGVCARYADESGDGRETACWDSRP